MGLLLALLAIVAIVTQTVMAARMAWRAKLKPGAIGLAILALASGAVPIYVYWRLR